MFLAICYYALKKLVRLPTSPMCQQSQLDTPTVSTCFPKTSWKKLEEIGKVDKNLSIAKN